MKCFSLLQILPPHFHTIYSKKHLKLQRVTRPIRHFWNPQLWVSFSELGRHSPSTSGPQFPCEAKSSSLKLESFLRKENKHKMYREMQLKVNTFLYG